MIKKQISSLLLLVVSTLITGTSQAGQGLMDDPELKHMYCNANWGPAGEIYNPILEGKVNALDMTLHEAVEHTLEQLHNEFGYHYTSVGHGIFKAMFDARLDGATGEEMNRLAVKLCMSSSIDPRRYDMKAAPLPK